MTQPATRRAARAPEPATGILRRTERPFTTTAFAGVAVLVVLVAGIVLHGSAVDIGVSRAANGLHTGAVAAVTNAVYHLFSPVWAIALTALATAVIWAVRRDLRPAAAFAVVIAGTWIPSDLVKLLVHRPRPDPAALPHPFSPTQVDPSFPSGHAVFAVAGAVALVALCSDTRAARAVAVLAPVGAVVVMCSLVVDGVHYPTDVLASALWSVGVAPFVLMLWVRFVAPRIPFLR